MFVDPSQSRDLCLQILRGQPTGRLLWYTTEWCVSDLAKTAGYADGIDFMTRDLGCAAFENLDSPFRLRVPQVEIVDTRDGDAVIREHRSPWGTLREVRREGNRVVEHPVSDERSLATLADMWEHLEVEIRPEAIDRLKARVAGRGTVGCCTPTSSLQQMIQHELGIANFWYAIADTPELVERAMAGYQRGIQTAYDALGRFDVDYFYQGENTSTTAISPDFYRKYSQNHIRQYCTAVAHTGKPAIVHMCGLLRDLLPLFPATGLAGIDCLTPPPVGNCPFTDAYDAMPAGFFCTGRLNSTLWVGETRQQILDNLAATLPHRLYREKPFILIVTTDAVEGITLENWRLLRDCLNEYEQA